MHVYKRGKRWWVQYTVGGVRRREALRCSDRVSAHRLAGDVVVQAERRHAGLDAEDPRIQHAPVADVVAEWAEALRAKGCTPKHVADRVQLVTSLAQLAGVVVWRSLTPTSIGTALRRLEHLSTRRRNRYLTATRQLCRWLVSRGYAQSDPTATIQKAREVATYERRALTDQELVRLLEVAERWGGMERRICYWLAASAGLRRGEIAALRRADLELGQSAYVIVRPASAKSRRERRVPLPLDLAAALRAHCKGQLPAARVVRPPIHLTVRKDLARAEIEHETEDGRAGFHALRVTYCTRLARAGAPLQVAQALMGHSDPKLTAGVYTRLRVHDTRAIAEALELPRPEGDCGSSCVRDGTG